MTATIEISGDHLEGGGQILRTASALSVIARRPLKVFNIRAKRPKPGLKPQHLHILKALARLSGAEAKGLTLDSREITFYPSEDIKISQLDIDVGTAGAIGLILQPLLLVGAFAPRGITLTIKGGTSGKGAVPVEYYPQVIFPILKRSGLNADLQIKRRGYYPKGGGQVEIDIQSLKAGKPIELVDPGKLLKITGLSCASKTLGARKVAERQIQAARVILAKELACPFKIGSQYADTLSLGSELNLYAHTEKGAILGSDARGQPHKTAEEVGREAAKELIKEVRSGCACDYHLADNLIPWLALLGGRIKTSSISLHTQTNIWVCEQFFGPLFKLEENTISVDSPAKTPAQFPA